MKARQLGRIRKYDRRDAGYLIQKPRKASTRTFRYWNSPIFDQGVYPRCVTWAWAGWLYAPPISNQFLDPVGLYEIAQLYDGIKVKHDGTTVRAGAKVLQMLGFISEYRWTTSIDILAQTILEVSPVVVGTNWYEGMNQPDAKGVLSTSGKLVGGHAYRIDGVNTETGMFRMANNWSSKWGTGGRALIPFAMMDKLLRSQGECCLAIEAEASRLAKAS